MNEQRPPNIALQRTRSAPLREPLSFGTLGRIKVLFAAVAMACIFACRAADPSDDRVAVTFTNTTPLNLNVVDIGWSATPGIGKMVKSIGPMRSGESKVVMLELVAPSQIIITVWSASCPASFSGPYLVPGTGYSASLEATASSTPVGEDSDCYTRLTIRGSIRASDAA